MPKLLIAGSCRFTALVCGLLPYRGKCTIMGGKPALIMSTAFLYQQRGIPFDRIIVENAMSPFYGHLLPARLLERGVATPVIVVGKFADAVFFKDDHVLLFEETLSRSTLQIGLSLCARRP